MEKLFVIEARYEAFTKEGKMFIPWFIYRSDEYTENQVKEEIKKLKTSCKDIDSKTKLKHEFRALPVEQYKERYKEIQEKIEENKKKYLEYKKSDKYKEIQKKKRQSAKERKERQKKYLEEHSS